MSQQPDNRPLKMIRLAVAVSFKRIYKHKERTTSKSRLTLFLFYK